MENQHRELTQEESDLINEVKSAGMLLQELVSDLRGDADVDQRWVSIGVTDLQKGLMALTRAVTKPDFF